jgi:uncharacterized protein YndB with AHSA1/START domain
MGARRQRPAGIAKEGPRMAFENSRKIAASPDAVFAAFADGARLARWWGQAGFTNTFATFEFKPGGRWSFTMHGPDGRNYPNEIVVKSIERDRKIVMHHSVPPLFLLTTTLEPTADGGTTVHWKQEFEDPEFERRMAQVLIPSNEQNLDRLSAEVLGPRAGR